MEQGCYRTDAMLPYVACSGAFWPAGFILNLPYLAFYPPLFAVGALGEGAIAQFLVFLAGTLFMWAPIGYLAWLGLGRLPPRLALVLGLLGITFGLVQTFSVNKRGEQDRTARNAAAGGGGPPQLWSAHKRLGVPAEECAALAFEALTALRFSSLVRNGNYSYGNFRGNRAAVKCIDDVEGSFVYFAVAGPDKDVVEQLRNAIGGAL